MPFEAGNKVGVRFSNDYQPATNGYPKGRPNRGTIARKVLELVADIPDATFEQIRTVFPTIERAMSSEEVMTLVILHRAIRMADVNAYKAVMDSAYGPVVGNDDDNSNVNIVINIGSDQRNDTIDITPNDD